MPASRADRTGRAKITPRISSAPALTSTTASLRPHQTTSERRRAPSGFSAGPPKQTSALIGLLRELRPTVSSASITGNPTKRVIAR